MVALHTAYLIFQTLKDYFISLYMYMHILNDSYLQLKSSDTSTFLAGNNWVVWSVSDKFSPQYDQHTERHLNMHGAHGPNCSPEQQKPNSAEHWL